jgi:hypothetical protein
MELRHLLHYIAVAEELRFSRAAERLQIEHPPLSRAIKDLEHDLDVQLLERTMRSTCLTGQGKSETGMTHRPVVDGECISGTYRRNDLCLPWVLEQTRDGATGVGWEESTRAKT